MLRYSANEARKLGHNLVGLEHVFLAILQDRNNIWSMVLKEAGIIKSQFEDCLMDVLCENMTPIIKELKLMGADLDSESSRHHRSTPLTLAACKGLPVVLKALCDAGADAYRRNRSGHAAVHVATYGFNPLCLRGLRKANTPMNQIADNGEHVTRHLRWKRAIYRDAKYPNEKRWFDIYDALLNEATGTRRDV